jgi:hypothetical protein
LPPRLGGYLLNAIAGLLGRHRLWRAPTRYRIACLYEDGPPPEAQFWRRWPVLFRAIDALIQSLPEPSFIRSVQYDPLTAREDDCAGQVTRFRKLRWSESNNRRWVEDLIGRPQFQLDRTEICSPWVGELQSRRRCGPHLYLKIDAADTSTTAAGDFDWQSLTLGLRHDVLDRTMSLAQRLLDDARGHMSAPQLLVFDRTWAERGTYTSWVRVNGLEDSYPTMLHDWAEQNPSAVVARFDQSAARVDVQA